MNDSARAQIFARLRHTCRAADAEDIARALPAVDSAPGAPLPSSDLATAFLANVLKNKGTIDCVANRSLAVKALADYIYRHFRSHRLVAGNDANLAAMPWREAGVLPRFGTIDRSDLTSNTTINSTVNRHKSLF